MFVKSHLFQCTINYDGNIKHYVLASNLVEAVEIATSYVNSENERLGIDLASRAAIKVLEVRVVPACVLQRVNEVL